MNRLPTKPNNQRVAITRNKTLEIIRSELNLEQWSIWQPSNSRNAPKARVLTREITLEDDSKVTAKVKVGFTDEGVLTTEDQKTLYALMKQWEERGRTDAITSFSLKRLVKLLKKQWGSKNVEGLIKSLTRLRATPFTWTNSFYDSSTGETVEVLDTFNILSDLRIAKRSKGSVITKEAGYFKFHDLVLVNLQNNHTKPVLYEVAISFRSEVAQLLYNRLDRLLFDKTQYERRTKELFEDLGLEGGEYKKPSVRKRLLERAISELVDKPLTTGRIAAGFLEQTADGKDNKVVFRKGARAAALPFPETAEARKSEGEGESKAHHEAKGDPELRSQGSELVKHFYIVFHGSEKTHISSKAVDQAVSLIAQHGYEQAKYVIDFARRVSPETNYHPQTFGGILQYTARALAEYDDHLQRQERHSRVRAEEAERQRQEEGYNVYRQLALNAYILEQGIDVKELIATKQQELAQEKPTLFASWTEDAVVRFTEIKVRHDLAKSAGIESFEDYCERHRNREAAQPGQ
jgi:hypothetical protein